MKACNEDISKGLFKYYVTTFFRHPGGGQGGGLLLHVLQITYLKSRKKYLGQELIPTLYENDSVWSIYKSLENWIFSTILLA